MKEMQEDRSPEFVAEALEVGNWSEKGLAGG